jgi:hypothetical protein
VFISDLLYPSCQGDSSVSERNSMNLTTDNNMGTE